jgi:hypothetical protein
MNLYAHVILELPAPKEVSILGDLNLSAFSSSQDFFTFEHEKGSSVGYQYAVLSMVLTSSASCELEAYEEYSSAAACREQWRLAHPKHLEKFVATRLKISLKEQQQGLLYNTRGRRIDWTPTDKSACSRWILANPSPRSAETWDFLILSLEPKPLWTTALQEEIAEWYEEKTNPVKAGKQSCKLATPPMVSKKARQDTRNYAGPSGAYWKT